MPSFENKNIVAYILSCFPTVSETFVIEEVLELRRQNKKIIIFSLKVSNNKQPITKDVLELLNLTRYSPFLFSSALLVENLKLLTFQPKLYIRLIATIFFQLFSQPLELIKSLAIFPKTVYFASLAKSSGCLHLHAHFINVPQLLKYATIGVLTSKSEGFSNALIEYMAARLPIVATNVSGNPELLANGHTGFLVPLDDPKAMAQDIIQLLQNPKQAHLFGEAGRKQVEENFLMSRMVQETQFLYNNLLSR